jgi:tetratricopeptide (TPR) repeat protein
MKFVSTMALGLALALSATTVIGVQPATAAKEKKAKAPSFNLSKGVREAAAAAQTALAANDTATAGAQLAAAKAAASTPDDNYVIGSIAYDLGRKTSNQAQQMEGVEAMLNSGKVDASQQPSFYLALGQMAYQAKQFPKAETALDKAISLGASDPNAFALLVETKNQNGKSAEAVEALEAAIAKQKAAGQPVPTEWYGRGLSIALSAKGKDPATQAKLAAASGRIAEGWISAFPTKTNWRDALIIYRDVNRIDPDQELDLMRLMRTAGALKGERDYIDYVQSTYLKFPGEAKAVLEEGSAAGFVNLSAPGNAKEIYTIVKGKIAADKASLSKSASTGKNALATGDAYLGYGDWASAADLYRTALSKGGVDANVVNTRLGMALARAGQKDAAKQAFAQVTGSRAGLARYWLIYLDKSST